ncbi:alpha-amylase family protein [Actinoplanes aureus]|uniref:Alpha-amylase family protein n=1 Tax=Actinoplanes aureus TaxID=2792083 RepID=A0A931CDZ1_9ACTN|nr:alpha-amylase family protein [Actinoplanes aureus]MBG0564408.1 alpha-amylase family protein [Actinoplanes aureus]
MHSWPEHVMWWHVYPLGFTGAPIRPAETESGVVHRLAHLEAWLDHVVRLGLNGIALGPIFASATHGYDTVDYFRIDPRLGDDGDFDRLVAAAHDRGIRVQLDGVFHHVARTHPAFREVESAGPDAPSAGMFRIDWAGWQPGDAVRADVFEGHDTLVALNHEAPEVTDLVVRVMNHWLDRGVDAWRLDAAYAVPPTFWAGVLPRVRESHPEAWFSGEVIRGDYAGIVRVSTMDTVTQYELWQAIWHGIADRNFYELAHAVKRNNELLATFVPSTFVGNHDVTRLASAVGADFVPHAVAVLCTVAGVPSVYAGDEYGWSGVKEQRFGGDDAVRPQFPDVPPPGNDTVRMHHDLISLRRRNPWLLRAHTDVVHLANKQIVLRTGTASGAVIAALNLDDEPATVPAADASSIHAGNGRLAGSEIHLPARGWAVFV